MTENFIMPQRVLGRTGERISVVGFGGIVAAKHTQAEAEALVNEAVVRGCNYFDVAPTYYDAEDRVGPALAPWRDKIFLSCKTACRDAKGARAELEQSLMKMQTDHFDLYQLHGVTDVAADVEAAFAADGAMEVLVKARDEGKIRFLGFSGHTPAALCRCMELFDFDTMMLPVNFSMHINAGFDKEPLRMATERNMGVIALKAMARTAWGADQAEDHPDWPKCWYEPLTEVQAVQTAMEFTLSRPGVTTMLPPGDARLWHLAMDVLPKIRLAALDSERALDNARQMASVIAPLFDGK